MPWYERFAQERGMYPWELAGLIVVGLPFAFLLVALIGAGLDGFAMHQWSER